MAASFRDAFCARYHCRPEEFHQKAIAHCLYPHAQTFWPLLDLLGAKTTFAAETLMELAAEARSEEDLRAAIRQYLDEVYPHVGMVAKKAGLRVSTKKLLALYRALEIELQTRHAVA